MNREGQKVIRAYRVWGLWLGGTATRHRKQDKWEEKTEKLRPVHPDQPLKIDGSEAFDLSDSPFVLLPMPSCCSSQPQTPSSAKVCTMGNEAIVPDAVS